MSGQKRVLIYWGCLIFVGGEGACGILEDAQTHIHLFFSRIEATAIMGIGAGHALLLPPPYCT